MPISPSTEQKSAYRKFFESLQYVLPCVSCQKHLREIVKKYPINVESREKCAQWLVEVHNVVNESLGKPRLSFDDVARHYLSSSFLPTVGLVAEAGAGAGARAGARAKHPKRNYWWIWFLVVVLPLLLVIISRIG